MQLRKEFILALSCLFIFVGFINTAQAKKSVFIISRHNTPSKAQVYSIESEGVTYQDEVDISTYNPGIGAVANAVWPEKDLMFVTYESSDMIVWASTKTLKKVGEYDTDISNLAGIAVDTYNELIYVLLHIAVKNIQNQFWDVCRRASGISTPLRFRHYYSTAEGADYTVFSGRVSYIVTSG